MCEEFVQLIEDRGGYKLRAPLSISDNVIINRTYFDVFEKELLKTCSNCFYDAIIEIVIELKKRGVKFNIKMKKYKIKEYHCVQYKGYNYSYNSKMFTDEIAEDILREMPQYANCIEVIGDVVTNVDEPLINIDNSKKTGKTVKTEQVEQTLIKVDAIEDVVTEVNLIGN